MDDIYMLSDTIIFNRIGSNLKAARLKQNITQQSLADAADISLSSLLPQRTSLLTIGFALFSLPPNPRGRQTTIVHRQVF